MTEWNIKAWCWQPGSVWSIPITYNRSVQSQVDTPPDMLSDVARTQNNKTEWAEDLSSWLDRGIQMT